MTEYNAGPVRIDTSTAHSARVYDYLLGGKTNYPVDEKLAETVLAADPTVRNTALANRYFMHRAARWLADHGIRQYIDIGTGIPTEPNLHQVAQEAAPESRVVYVDNDPIVLRHAEALLDSTPEGVTDYLQADVRDPGRIIDAARKSLDFDKPVALSVIALLHFVSDEDDAYGIVRALVDELPPGSYLVAAHVTGDFDPERAEQVIALYRQQGTTLRPRSRPETARFFDGLELTDPGLVLAPEWHPGLGRNEPTLLDIPVPVYVGVARKA
jgi:hypothetical protein